MANVLGSMVVQDLTYTQAHHGLAFTITYVNGGVAGQEEIFLGDTDIIIKIASGTSTATQIVAAVNAKPQALALVSVAVTGTGSNVQVSAVRAFLSGGVSSEKAAYALPHAMRLEARTAGTAGNSITIQFTDTGTVGASATGSAITVTVDDTVTTYQEVRDALAEDAGCSNLIGVFNPLDLHEFIIDIVADSLPTSPASFAGGVAATNQAVVIQDLTYTSTTAGPSNKRQSVTYTIGATAGSEVVTLDANGSETIQIENGVSTATQIKAAHDASAPALALRTVAVTGTGSTAQKTVNALATVASEATPSTKDYFQDQTVALTGSFVAYPFGFHAETITIHNDESAGVEVIEWSFNGTDLGGRLLPTESITLDHLEGGLAVISLRGDADAYRLMVVGK